MRLTILNGNPDKGNSVFEGYIEALKNKLTENGHNVDTFLLREADIKYCVGCWGCWIKTPGECLHPDDTIGMRRSIINSDITIFASPIVAGYTSGLLKKIQDKMLPLLMPNIIYYKGEMHHLKRYPSYPRFACIVQWEQNTEAPVREIFETLYKRFSINFHTSVLFVKDINEPVEEAVNALTAY